MSLAFCWYLVLKDQRETQNGVQSFSLFLQLLVNRSKRKRRRKADKALTGNEKVKLINMRTGKKVRHPIGFS